MTRRIAPIAFAAVADCATTDEPQIDFVNQQRCAQEARIGSNIPATKCYDRMAAEQQRRDTDHIVDQIRRAPARNISSTASGGD